MSPSAEAGNRTHTPRTEPEFESAATAIDAAGVIVGEYIPRDIRRGGTLRWADREFTLCPASALRERYALRERDRDLAVLDGRSWGKRPVKVILHESTQIEPGLLLFAAFIVHRLAATADSSAAGSTAAVTSSTSG